MPPTLNLLAEVLLAEEELMKAQRNIDRRQKTLIGKLPLVRSALEHRQIDNAVKLIRIEAAKQYLNSIE